MQKQNEKKKVYSKKKKDHYKKGKGKNWYVKKFNNKKFFLKKKFQKPIFKRFRYKHKLSGRPFKSYHFLRSKKYFNLSITIKPNNIFCLLAYGKQNKVISCVSGGKFKIKLTKKKLRSFGTNLVYKFIKVIRSSKLPYSKFMVINVLGPKRMRKRIVRYLMKHFLQNFVKGRPQKLIMNYRNYKTYNGCAVSKIKNKKGRGLRLFK